MLLASELSLFIAKTCLRHALIAPDEMFYTFGHGSIIADVKVDVFVVPFSLRNNPSSKVKQFWYRALGNKVEIYDLTIARIQSDMAAKLNNQWQPTLSGEYRICEISVRGAIIDKHPSLATPTHRSSQDN